MKRVLVVLLLVVSAAAVQAQITKGEMFLGGNLNIISSSGFDQVTIVPEFKYALSEKGMVGVSAGVSSSAGINSFIIGPNYTWLFNIEGNLFWLLTGYGQVTFGDTEDVSIGAYPGLGYRIHERFLVALTNGGFLYSTALDGIALNAGLNGLGVRAYIRISK
jgi:hypothetical protein